MFRVKLNVELRWKLKLEWKIWKYQNKDEEVQEEEVEKEEKLKC